MENVMSVENLSGRVVTSTTTNSTHPCVRTESGIQTQSPGFAPRTRSLVVVRALSSALNIHTSLFIRLYRFLCEGFEGSGGDKNSLPIGIPAIH